jgi:hypothetical protein
MAKRYWAKGKKSDPICLLGPPDDDVCHNLSLLRAEESTFHDQALIDATEQINAIFRELREKAPGGRHLALINTSLGLLLIWAEEATEPPERPFVTYRSREKQIREALGLVD